MQSSLPLHPLVKHPWLACLWLRLVYVVIKLFFRLCCQVRIEGSEHIPSKGGVVLVSNHVSGFDTVLLPYTVLAKQGLQIIWSPAKAELFRRRLVGWVLTSLGVFPVRRGQHDRQAMRQMIAGMRTDKTMLFPEGTRSRTGGLVEAKPGVSYLAAKLGYPIVPAALAGTADKTLFQNLRHLRKTHVILKAGKPFTLPALPVKDREEALQRYTDEIMCQIAVLLPEEYRGVYKEHPRLKELLEASGTLETSGTSGT